jgi:four helix bundle protein
MTGQIRRAATSVPTNLAEGHSRRSRQAFINHVSIALGSQAELETLLELAKRLRLVVADDIERVVAAATSVGRLLYGLHRALVAEGTR